MDHQKLEEAFLQGDENEAVDLFNEMMRKSVRLGLLSALEEEVTALRGPLAIPIRKAPIDGQEAKLEEPTSTAQKKKSRVREFDTKKMVKLNCSSTKQPATNVISLSKLSSSA